MTGFTATTREGIAGLCNRPATGRKPKLTKGLMVALQPVVLASPDPAVDKIGEIADLIDNEQLRPAKKAQALAAMSLPARPWPMW